jgi:hypothetical protein
MNHYVAFASVFAIVAAQGSSPTGYGIANATNASIVDGGTPVLKSTSGNTAANAVALSDIKWSSISFTTLEL